MRLFKFMGEERIRKFFKEDEELKLEREREVLPQKRREEKVKKIREWIERGPSVATRTTVQEVVDEGFPVKRGERLQWWKS